MIQDKKALIFITKSNFGGAQKYVLDLAIGLKAKEIKVKVVTGGNGILIQKLKEKDIEVETIPELQKNISITKEFSVFKKLLEILKKEKPDVLHLNSSKISAIGSLAGRICGIKKIIFTAHGWAFNENRNLISKLLIKISYFMILLLSHNIIAVSENIKKDAGKIPLGFIFNKKIKVIKNGIKDINFLSKEESREILELKNDDFVIGTIAELHPIKNIELIIKVANQIENVKFVIIGEGQYREELENLIFNYHLQSRVLLIGFKDNAHTYLKAFDIFILPSKSEALGYVLLETGLAGLPSIASRVGGIPEIIEDEETGLLFENNNSRNLENKIKELIENEDKRTRLGIKLKEKVQEEFVLEKMIEKTIGVYKS